MDSNFFRPEIIKTNHEAHGLLKKKSSLSFVDAFSRQIKELFFIDNHKFIGQDKEKVYRSIDFQKYVETRRNNFNFFYYPWNISLVKCIDEESYFRLKTNRNQDLITAEEQTKLASYRVAVFGLSVGSNIAFVLTQTGISKKIIIADFDCLDTTNINRILAGVHEIGLNKTIIAARRIYEDNPYAKVSIYPRGVSKKSVEEMLRAKKVDCLIDEIDDIPLKIDIRILAMKYKIPVIMITDNGDGVVLRVERYDLGYSKIFGENESYWQEKITYPLTKAQAGQIIINNIVGGKDKVDPKMLYSVKKVLSGELVSWSQLGSAALLGGVATTLALKKLVLGQDKKLFTLTHINLRI